MSKLRLRFSKRTWKSIHETQAPTLEGYLNFFPTKKGSEIKRHLNSTKAQHKHRKYFRLVGSNLFCLENDTEDAKLLCVLECKNLTSVILLPRYLQQKTSNSAFQIITSRAAWVLQAPSKQIARQWIEACKASAADIEDLRQKHVILCRAQKQLKEQRAAAVRREVARGLVMLRFQDRASTAKESKEESDSKSMDALMKDIATLDHLIGINEIKIHAAQQMVIQEKRKPLITANKPKKRQPPDNMESAPEQHMDQAGFKDLLLFQPKTRQRSTSAPPKPVLKVVEDSTRAPKTHRSSNKKPRQKPIIRAPSIASEGEMDLRRTHSADISHRLFAESPRTDGAPSRSGSSPELPRNDEAQSSSDGKESDSGSSDDDVDLKYFHEFQRCMLTRKRISQLVSGQLSDFDVGSNGPFFVRYMRTTENGRTHYRIAELIELRPGSDSVVLDYAGSTKEVHLHSVSNSIAKLSEFKYWKVRMLDKSLTLPTVKKLSRSSKKVTFLKYTLDVGQGKKQRRHSAMHLPIEVTESHRHQQPSPRSPLGQSRRSTVTSPRSTSPNAYRDKKRKKKKRDRTFSDSSYIFPDEVEELESTPSSLNVSTSSLSGTESESPRAVESGNGPEMKQSLRSLPRLNRTSNSVDESDLRSEHSFPSPRKYLVRTLSRTLDRSKSGRSNEGFLKSLKKFSHGRKSSLSTSSSNLGATSDEEG